MQGIEIYCATCSQLKFNNTKDPQKQYRQLSRRPKIYSAVCSEAHNYVVEWGNNKNLLGFRSLTKASECSAEVDETSLAPQGEPNLFRTPPPISEAVEA